MTTILWAKFPTEVNNLLLQFAGMPQEQVLNIFHNQFEPINLYQIRYMHGLPHEPCYSQEEIGIEDGMLYSMKILGFVQGFGKFFGRRMVGCLCHPHLHTLPIKYSAMIKWHNNNHLNLSRMYKWQDPLLLAIGVHTHIISQSSSNFTRWIVSTEFQGRFHNSMTLPGMASPVHIEKETPNIAFEPLGEAVRVS